MSSHCSLLSLQVWSTTQTNKPKTRYRCEQDKTRFQVFLFLWQTAITDSLANVDSLCMVISYVQVHFPQIRHHLLSEMTTLSLKCHNSLGSRAQKLLKVSPHVSLGCQEGVKHFGSSLDHRNININGVTPEAQLQLRVKLYQ
jgi:hypothetical protein